MQASMDRRGLSIRERVLLIRRGGRHPLLRPVENDAAAKLSGHTAVHQLLPKPSGLAEPRQAARPVRSTSPRLRRRAHCRIRQGPLAIDSAPYFAELVASSWMTRPCRARCLSHAHLGADTRNANAWLPSRRTVEPGRRRGRQEAPPDSSDPARANEIMGAPNAISLLVSSWPYPALSPPSAT